MKKPLDQMQRVIGWFAILFGVLGLSALYVFTFPEPVLGHVDVMIGSRVMHLEIARTPAQQHLGLGGRASLPADSGMLFVFPQPGIYPFWMKGMHFPLDIIWMDHGVVTDVVTLPSPATDSAEPAVFTPTHPADRVLEINAGISEKIGIVAGSRLRLTISPSFCIISPLCLQSSRPAESSMSSKKAMF